MKISVAFKEKCLAFDNYSMNNDDDSMMKGDNLK